MPYNYPYNFYNNVPKRRETMDKVELLREIFEIVILPILGALALFAVKWINAKAEELKAETEDATLEKYIDMLADTITQCVIATNQTYVETLKKEGKFDKEAQINAFNMTYQAVLAILSVEAKEYLTEAVGDFETFLIKQIEAEVNYNKVVIE